MWLCHMYYLLSYQKTCHIVIYIVIKIRNDLYRERRFWQYSPALISVICCDRNVWTASLYLQPEQNTEIQMCFLNSKQCGGVTCERDFCFYSKQLSSLCWPTLVSVDTVNRNFSPCSCVWSSRQSTCSQLWYGLWDIGSTDLIEHNVPVITFDLTRSATGCYKQGIGNWSSTIINFAD